MNQRIAVFMLFTLNALPTFAANLTVNFLQPEKFTDAVYNSSFPNASQRNASERNIVQQDIEAHLQKLAAQNLPADYVLKIDVLDIDLAGRVEPLAFPMQPDLRIVHDIAWPRMKLRYTLQNGEQVVKSGEEKVSDMNFMFTHNRYWNSDRLRYEKAMLDNWFKKNLAIDGRIIESKKEN